MAETNPICSRCSRNARTVDTPRVKVRVERAMAWRENGKILVRAWCHGEVATRELDGMPDDLSGVETFT